MGERKKGKVERVLREMNPIVHDPLRCPPDMPYAPIISIFECRG